jgi:tRNA-splicing ligase RtcB
MKITNKDLKVLGDISNITCSILLEILNSKTYRYVSIDERIDISKKVLANPELYIEDNVWNKLVSKLVVIEEEYDSTSYEKETPKPFTVFGSDLIDDNTKVQMSNIMSLPNIIKGALMPDSHVGYGLPIGGVISTSNSVIPYAVGYDIGCMMKLSIFNVDEKFLHRYKDKISKIIVENTHFGNENGFDYIYEHDILDDTLFDATPFLKSLHRKACYQLGTSGSSNHFVDVGLVDISNNILGIPHGKYLAVLSHSGSRNMGFKIAEKYTEIARKVTILPKDVKNMAWFDLDTELGQEYWLSMTLAGKYASACHDVIHSKIAKALNVDTIKTIENHHNLAWKENDTIIHRKGATPAQNGEFGIIPGSMVHKAYIIQGKGNIDSLNSASHGAGRVLSRGDANNSLTKNSLKKILNEYGVDLIGGTVEESPMVYKNIDDVMKHQQNLVDIVADFKPYIVRMSDEEL